MEFILIVIAIAILIILLNIKNNLSDRISTLDSHIQMVLDEIRKMQRQLDARPPAVEKRVEEVVAHKVPPVIIPKLPVIKPEPIKEKVDPIPEIKKEAVKEEIREEIKKPVVITETYRPEPQVMFAKKKEDKPGFFERNPDLEKFIGENLANKIGIGVLVLGIGFFVKYAIDQNWIGEIGRVFIGIVCGGILLGIAHYMRKKFTAFSSVLVGGGIAVLYLTIAIAFHEYNLFSQTGAFLIMLVITGFAIVFSLTYNRIELAVLSLLGGFASPFMVSTGEGNYAVLFTYILILDVGMLVLAYFKKWNLVNIIAYVFTLILFASWLSVRFDEDDVFMMRGGLIFATLFYFVFFGMNIINNLKERTKFQAIEISILLSNTFFYYGAGMFLLSGPHGEPYKGLFTSLLGVFNFMFAFTLYKNNRVDKNLVFLLIGLVLTFITLAAPVQLEGNYITLFWAAEAVLLLWLSQKSGIRLMKLASLVITVLMVFSLLMDWEQIYFKEHQDTLRIIFNKGYIASFFAMVSVALTILLLRNEKEEQDAEYVKMYRITLSIGGGLLFYVSHLLELRHQLSAYGFSYVTQNIIIGCYNMLFIVGALLAERKWIKDKKIMDAFALLGPLAIGAYMLFYQWQFVEARNDFAIGGESATGFIFHYIFIALMVIISIMTLRKFQQMMDFNRETRNAYAWFYVVFFVFLASAELDSLVAVFSGVTSSESLADVIGQNHKIGYPILWGMASFLIIFLGLQWKKKHLRIISLTLFLLTLLKLFIVDIRGISEGGKIAAFISLGVLLLIVSFMYQRLKKLLLADEPKTASDESTIKTGE